MHAPRHQQDHMSLCCMLRWDEHACLPALHRCAPASTEVRGTTLLQCGLGAWAGCDVSSGPRQYFGDDYLDSLAVCWGAEYTSPDPPPPPSGICGSAV